MKLYRVTIPLEIYGEFDDSTSLDDVKESLGQELDSLLESTDYLGDYWKAAEVEEVWMMTN